MLLLGMFTSLHVRVSDGNENERQTAVMIIILTENNSMTTNSCNLKQHLTANDILNARGNQAHISLATIKSDLPR